MSIIIAKVRPEKYLVPSVVPVISSSYIATRYQCDPPPYPLPSWFYRIMPGKEEHPKNARAQAFTKGVVMTEVAGRLACTLTVVLTS